MTSLPIATALLLQQVRSCTLCAPFLPFGVRPVLQVHPAARILVVGQAPGIKVHRSGIPFDDASGERLRDWMGISSAVFYDPTRVAIVPMGFCYPGTGKSGDLAPRSECAPRWRQQVLEHLPAIALTLVIGQYAQAWHLPLVAISDAFTLFIVAVFVVQGLEMWLRAGRLLTEARAGGPPSA